MLICPGCKCKLDRVKIEIFYRVTESDFYYIESVDPDKAKPNLEYWTTRAKKDDRPYMVKVYCPNCHSLLCELSCPTTKIAEEVKKCLKG